MVCEFNEKISQFCVLGRKGFLTLHRKLIIDLKWVEISKKFQALKCSVGYGLQAHERDFAEKLSIKSAESLKNFPRFGSAHCTLLNRASIFKVELKRLDLQNKIELLHNFA